jgi:hypothetical protein
VTELSLIFSTAEDSAQTAMAHGGRALIASILSDTVASVGDLVPARTLPVCTIGVLMITAELFFAYMIRDNLVLSIVQLSHPSKAISNW